MACQYESRLRCLTNPLRFKRRNLRARGEAGGELLGEIGVVEQPRPHFELLQNLFYHRNANTQLVEHLLARDLHPLWLREQLPQERDHTARR